LSGQATTLESLREIAQEDPDAVAHVASLEAELPADDPTLEWIWKAWQRLRHDRPLYGGGMGPAVPGRIPWTVVRAWGQYHRLRRGEFEMLDLCFAVLDGVYIAWYLAEQKKSTPE
jgi:hypothetical protein